MSSPSESSTPSRRTILAEGRYIRCIAEGRWEYVERANCAGAVMIVAVTREGALLVIEQPRIPMGRPVIELPAGLIGDEEGAAGETVEAAALRELLEETGYQAERVDVLASGAVSAGLSSETVTLVRAVGLTKQGAGGGVGHEAIIVHEVPLPDVDGWLRMMQAQGKMIDVKIYAGLYLLRHAAG